MSDHPDFPPSPQDQNLPPMVVPSRQPPRPQSAPSHPMYQSAAPSGFGRVLLALLLLGSLGMNLLLFAVLIFGSAVGTDSEEGPPIYEKHYSHSKTARDKIAVVRVEGLLIDETMGYAHKQIDKAANDSDVKAVVLRINSPGGTVTASDELHRRLTQMRDGTSTRYSSPPKPLVVSMGGVAASGGYYIAMPARHIFVERTTITGSIGVYWANINISELAKNNGVKMEIIKAGGVKASGSMFHEMTPQERQLIQDSVSNSYDLFVKVVEEGRPHLKGQLTKDLVLKDKEGNEIKEVFQYDAKGNKLTDKPKVPYRRQIADGGIFTAEDAIQHKLVDGMGDLDDAVKEAARLANLTSDYQVVVYERPVSLFSLFSGSVKAGNPLDLSKLGAASQPRAWFLAPNNELAAFLELVK